jgi:SAM-dependent methyltransferase
MSPSRSERLKAEIEFYREVENVADLPGSFIAWSGEFLLPKLQAMGYVSIEDIWIRAVGDLQRERAHGALRIVSLGAGNCENEVALAEALIKHGISEFSIDCLELSSFMIERGRSLIQEKQLSAKMRVIETDLNEWVASETYDVFFANHSLHHIEGLEHLFSQVSRSMAPDGVFLVNDMIGRNGHMRWPEAMSILNVIWSSMPRRYKYNHLLDRVEDEYENWDCSVEGFEGIRAQDILPLLISNFEFKFFLGFGNLINVFVDRAFGHNFDPLSSEDMTFIRRVAAVDEELLLMGALKPTQMFGVLVRKGTPHPQVFLNGVTPEFSVRLP